jgi:UDP-N-acetylmuramyl pentapeptide phosphotransferase/UDP-N-acetylglucosamine-1-phosphate transferase
MDLWERLFLCSGCDVERFGSVSFHSPFFKNTLGFQVGWLAVCVMQWLDDCFRISVKEKELLLPGISISVVLLIMGIDTKNYTT